MAPLFRQGELSIDLEASTDNWRSGIRLASADADCVISRSDDRITILGHHTQITILQLEVNLLARTRFQMNALESAESDLGSTLDLRELEIDLYRFISRNFAGVGYGDVGGDRLSRSYCLLRNTEVAVLEGWCS